MRSPLLGMIFQLSSVSSSPTLNFPSECVHLLLFLSPPSPESHTPEHLTSTGLLLCSVCPRHRRIVTSARLIFSPGYERLMERGRRGGWISVWVCQRPRAPPVRELSLPFPWNCRGSVVLAEVLKGRRHHAELSTLVSLSVYLPLLRILHQLFGLQHTLLSFLQQTMTSNTVSSGIFERRRKKKKSLNFWQLSMKLGEPRLQIHCDVCPAIATGC